MWIVINSKLNCASGFISPEPQAEIDARRHSTSGNDIADYIDAFVNRDRS
jgi:hypothetical protein